MQFKQKIEIDLLNSKVVAKGDLIQLGEMIGVKINEVGN